MIFSTYRIEPFFRIEIVLPLPLSLDTFNLFSCSTPAKIVGQCWNSSTKCGHPYLLSDIEGNSAFTVGLMSTVEFLLILFSC